MLTYQHADAMVVRCSGRLTGDSTDVFRDEVKAQIPLTRRIILDFTDLKHIDSTGLGAIVRVYVSARADGCDLQLVNLTPGIRKLLGLTNLFSVFGECGKYLTRMP